jgi:hypothetical protein
MLSIIIEYCIFHCSLVPVVLNIIQISVENLPISTVLL